MTAKALRNLAVTALAVSLATFCACSRVDKKQEKAKAARPAAGQAAEAIRDFGKRPIDRAKATQKLGDERTRSVDEAVRSQTKP